MIYPAPSLRTPEARNLALEATLLTLRAEDALPALRGWRGECYVTRLHSSSYLVL